MYSLAEPEILKNQVICADAKELNDANELKEQLISNESLTSNENINSIMTASKLIEREITTNSNNIKDVNLEEKPIKRIEILSLKDKESEYIIDLKTNCCEKDRKNIVQKTKPVTIITMFEIFILLASLLPKLSQAQCYYDSVNCDACYISCENDQNLLNSSIENCLLNDTDYEIVLSENENLIINLIISEDYSQYCLLPNIAITGEDLSPSSTAATIQPVLLDSTNSIIESSGQKAPIEESFEISMELVGEIFIAGLEISNLEIKGQSVFSFNNVGNVTIANCSVYENTFVEDYFTFIIFEDSRLFDVEQPSLLIMIVNSNFTQNEFVPYKEGALISFENTIQSIVIEQNIFNSCIFFEQSAIVISNNYGTLSFAQNVFSNNIKNMGSGAAINIQFSENVIEFEENYYENNYAEFSGGAIAITDSESTNTLKNEIFIGNKVKQEGGGALDITKAGGELHLIGCEFIKNTLEAPENTENSRGGGALRFFMLYEKLIFKNNYYSGNSVTGYEGSGGALYLEKIYSITEFLNELFIGNSVANSEGGALYATTITMDMNFTNITFENNKAEKFDGGAVSIASFGGKNEDRASLLLFSNCTFKNNFVLEDGSALKIKRTSGRVFIRTCLFRNNVNALSGGAIYYSEYDLNHLDLLPAIEPQTVLEKYSEIVEENTLNYSALYIYDSEFLLNSAFQGGAINIAASCRVIINKSVFIENNSTTSYAGAIAINLAYEEIVIHNSYFEHNLAKNSVGGAICAIDNLKPLYLINSSFQYNFAMNGGALNIEKSMDVVYIEDVIFIKNEASSKGGAVYTAKSMDDVYFEDVTFIKNEASSDGGAIYVHEALQSLILNETQSYENQADGNGGFTSIYEENIRLYTEKISCNMDKSIKEEGGAIFLRGKNISVSIFNSNFNNLEAELNGGAISAKGEKFDIELTDSSFINCISVAVDAGAVNLFFYKNNKTKDENYNTGTFNVFNCTFKNNIAKIRGGSICLFLENHNITVAESKFISNTARNYIGGAISVNINNSFYTVKVSYFESNIAQFEGGALEIANENSTIQILNNIFYSNKITYSGAAIYIESKGENISIKENLFEENLAMNMGGAIYLEDIYSATTIDNCFFIKNEASGEGAAIFIKNSYELINFEYNEFENNIAESIGASLYSEGDLKEFNIERNIFKDNLAFSYSGAIHIETSQYKMQSIPKVVIEDSCFINNSAQSSGAIYLVTDYMLFEMSNTIMTENSGEAGGAIRTGNLYNYSVSISLEMNIENCQFHNNSASKSGGFIHSEEENLIIFVENCTFTSNTANYGGVITIFGIPGNVYLQLSNSYFGENRANYEGGDVYLEGIILYQVENCSFNQSQALRYSASSELRNVENITIENTLYEKAEEDSAVGGVLYITKLDEATVVNVYLSFVNFTQSYAYESIGSALYIRQPDTFVAKNCIFSNNLAVIAPALVLISDYLTLCETEYSCTEQRLLNGLPFVRLTRNKFIDNIVLNEAKFAGDVRIILLNQTQQTATFMQTASDWIKQRNVFDSISSTALSLQCDSGEYFNIYTHECMPCSEQYYSVGGYIDLCDKCLSNVECRGGYQLPLVDSGYWSPNVTTVEALECEYTETQCLGGAYCLQGYTGLLCEDCNALLNYRRSQSFECSPCSSEVLICLRLAFGVLFAAAMVLYVVYSNYDLRVQELTELVAKKICRYLIRLKDDTTVCFKIFVNHAQLLMILMQIPIEYPKFLMSHFEYVGRYVDAFSYDFLCLANLDKNMPPAYQRVLFTHLLLLLTLALLLYVLIMLKFVKKIPFKKYAASTTINLLYLALPSTVNQLLMLVSQRTVPGLDGRIFVEMEISIEWNSAEFKLYTKWVVVPLLLFWLAVLFMCSYIIIARGKQFFKQINCRNPSISEQVVLDDLQRENEPNQIKWSERTNFLTEYGNFFVGYTPECYWWEIIAISEKVLFIFFSRIFSESTILVTSYLLVLTVTMLAFQLFKKPFESHKMENISIATVMIQICSIAFLQGLYIDSEGGTNFYFNFLLLLLTNQLIFIYMLQHIVRENFILFRQAFYGSMLENSCTAKLIKKIKFLAEGRLYKSFKRESERDKFINSAWYVLIDSVTKFIYFKKIRGLKYIEVGENKVDAFYLQNEIVFDECLKETFQEDRFCNTIPSLEEWRLLRSGKDQLETPKEKAVAKETEESLIKTFEKNSTIIYEEECELKRDKTTSEFTKEVYVGEDTHRSDFESKIVFADKHNFERKFEDSEIEEDEYELRDIKKAESVRLCQDIVINDIREEDAQEPDLNAPVDLLHLQEETKREKFREKEEEKVFHLMPDDSLEKIPEKKEND